MSVRGFILQPTYRIRAGRPVVELFGRLEGGEPFLLRDTRQRPSFWIAEHDAERARELGARQVIPSDLWTFDGTAAARVELILPSDAPALRDRLTAAGIPCYEADIRFAMRYLMDRGIRGAIEIDGEGSWRPGLGRVFEDPEIRPTKLTPELRVLSFDIETDPRARRLLSIALHGCGTSEVLLFTPEGWTCPADATPCASERELLGVFCERVRALDPDVLTGWNVIDFDLRVLDRLARHWRQPLRLGRDERSLSLRPSRAPWASLEARITGRIVLDGIQLLRSSFVKMERYGLDAVAREVLGEGKTLGGHDRAGEILDTFKNDRERFVIYNGTDARLVTEILDELHLVDLAVQRSRLTGLPIDRVAGSIAAFDFLYISALRRQRIVAPTVNWNDEGGEGTGDGEGTVNLGGHVLEPEVGLYDNVLVCDFKSLYPSLIRTFQIDPLGYIERPTATDDPIEAPNGACFRRRPGILPALLDELFPRREAAKAAGDKVASHAIKILMNSFYGVLGTRACRFSRPQLAGAITAFGRELLLWSKARFESYGLRVLYGDTDSLFVLSGEDDPADAQRLGEELVVRLNQDLAAHVTERWRVESRLELELERLYRKLFLPAMRHRQGGARKRYVGLVGKGDDAEVVFTGMEVVRRDWTELAKRVQRQLYYRLFHQQPVEGYLDSVVSNLRKGRLDELLTYRKGLGKPLESYTSTTPPHVAAARKARTKPGRVIDYVMTHDGAEPTDERRHSYDYEHYVQKQIRPVAEPVLELLGLEFDKVIGDDAQLELF